MQPIGKWPIMINTKDYVKIVRKSLACLQAQKTGDDTPQLIFLLLDFLALHFSNLSLSLFNVLDLVLFCFHLLAAGSEKSRYFWDFFGIGRDGFGTLPKNKPRR